MGVLASCLLFAGFALVLTAMIVAEVLVYGVLAFICLFLPRALVNALFAPPNER